MSIVTEQLDRLAQLDPVPYPVVSLYLNTQSGQHGRDQHQAFVRSEFKSRCRTYPEGSPERDSLDRDLKRITTFLETELQPSANGVAVFACSAGEIFETVQLSAPIDQHWLYIGDTPHLYPLARIESRYPRYAAVVADTNNARIFVIAAAELVKERAVTGQKTRRTSQGGWSQARFQRHIENYHVHHIKEVVATLERIVEQERIEHVILVGDEVVVPLFREQLSKPLADKVIDRLKLDTHASASEILDATIEAMQRQTAETEAQKVASAIDGYRAGALGIVGPEKTIDALVRGQVDELLIASSLQELDAPIPGASVAASVDQTIFQPAVETAAGGEAAQADPRVLRLSEELVRRAKQTGARVTVIEDASLLQEFGGVAALLRFRM